jgi:hypothetical protein
MADETLRLPNTIFRAVLDLGPKRAAALTLPARFSDPELYGELVEPENSSTLYVEFDDGQLHIDASAEGVEYHFHDGDGNESPTSPWPASDTTALIAWASLLIEDFHARMPELMEDIDEAAAWQESGYDLYVCVTEPAQLDLLEVEVEGEILTLPWLGAGEVNHDHLDGNDHPIALVWVADAGGSSIPIARAWLDQSTGEPATSAEPGIDWEAVGMPRDEVLSWLEDTYVNHHVIDDAGSALLRAVLERMGGLDHNRAEKR